MSAGAMRRLGKYELVARIGEGGMAEVHLARQIGPQNFEKLVVVKTVRPVLAERVEVASLLLEEARIAALVKHANVVDIYDLGEQDGTFFIAMEYLEGEALSAILKASITGARLDPFSTARIIHDCAAGLHAAHELHNLSGEPLELVHQDVTPGNVIVLYGGNVKLVDFGVAKVRTTADDGLIKGKTGYLAPELLDGALADRRCDIWSLGVVLWEALTLRRLFWARNEEEAVRKIRSAEVPPPSTLASAVPRDLDEICFRALTRNPERRYRTAQEMQSDIAEILRHASWSGGSEPIGRFMRATFAERIVARKELIRELAAGRAARSATLDRLREVKDDGSPVNEDGVVGAHGAPRAIPMPPADHEAARVEDAAVKPAPARRRGAAVVGGIAALALVAIAVLAMAGAGGGTRREAAAPPDAGPAIAAADTPVDAAVIVEAAAPPDAAVETRVPHRDDDKKRDRDKDRHRDKDRDKDRDHEKTSEKPPVSQTATAKSLYKDGLQAFVGGDVAAAIELFDQAREKSPGYAPTYRGLGMAYEKRGDRRRAAKAFERYLALAPNASDAVAIRARLEKLR